MPSLDDQAFDAMQTSSASKAHTALDLAGLSPGVGLAADLANAGLYASEGDWKNMGWSLLAAVPIVGQIATGKKTIKAIESAVRASKQVASLKRMQRLEELEKIAKIDFAGETAEQAFKYKEELMKLQRQVGDDMTKAYNNLTDAERRFVKNASPEQTEGIKNIVTRLGKLLDTTQN